MSNLVQVIFNQFVDLLECANKKRKCKFDECDFDYRSREEVSHKLIDILFVDRDNCGRPRDVIATIDYTNICLEDLTSCKWIEYLENIAFEFINDICPKKYVVIKDKVNKCRKQPPTWDPFPCNAYTTIVKKIQPKPEPECEVVIIDECECVPECIREPCVPKKKIFIKYEQEPAIPCCERRFLVTPEKRKKHDFGFCKGHTDYNNHLWNKCCESVKCSCH